MAADYFLMPSFKEPSGISQQEAFCYGCPVIAFCTGGLQETVIDQETNPIYGNGFLFYEYTVKALKSKILRVN